MSRLFFNHLDLPLAKVVLVLFGQKSSRFIARKILEKLQSSQLIARKVSKGCNYFDWSLAKVAKRCNHFDLSLAKIAKSCNHLDLSLAKVAKIRRLFFNQLNLPLASVFFFRRERKIISIYCRQKSQKPSTSKTKFKF